MTDINEIRKIFEEDKYLTMTDVSIDEAATDWCRCSMVVQPKHLNAAGTCQGGAIYTLADSAFAVASNQIHRDKNDGYITISQSASISYLAAALPGSTLIAEASKVGGGKRTPVFRIDITDDKGTPIAFVVGNGYDVRRKK